ncbi:annexin D3-like [Arachis stenosperma]|uniref:annexin D3-like n=1 Tax=Arachis stenosperma TaxID=217475 RepID=UPI0025AC2B70|nr:annexin D3-like [Arachis stenosperma]
MPPLNILLSRIVLPALNVATPSSSMCHTTPILSANDAAAVCFLPPSMTWHRRRARSLVLPLLQRYTSAIASMLLRRIFTISIACRFASFTQMNALILWVHEPEVRHAMLANKALKAMTNKIKELQVVVEIACGNKTVYVNGVREAYIDLYGCTIEEDILDCVYDMPLKKTLLALISSNRHSKETTKKEIAVEDASKMHEAIRKRRLDDDSFLWILSTRSISQLRETFATYQQLFDHSLEQDDLENLLIAAIRCTCNPEKHFAKVIRESMIGIGTDEESLNRAIVSRAEVDMLKIEIEYAAMFHSNLVKDICGDTSGSYQNFLMTLMGKDPLE